MADKNKGGMILSYVNSMPCVLWLFKTKPSWILFLHGKTRITMWISIKSFILILGLLYND